MSIFTTHYSLKNAWEDRNCRLSKVLLVLADYFLMINTSSLFNTLQLFFCQKYQIKFLPKPMTEYFRGDDCCENFTLSKLSIFKLKESLCLRYPLKSLTGYTGVVNLTLLTRGWCGMFSKERSFTCTDDTPLILTESDFWQTDWQIKRSKVRRWTDYLYLWEQIPVWRM